MKLEDQKQALEVLAMLRLCDDLPRDWTDNDLHNSLHILMSITCAMAFKKHYGTLSPEQVGILAEEFGKNLKQSIFLFTGVDTTDIVLDAEEIS